MARAVKRGAVRRGRERPLRFRAFEQDAATHAVDAASVKRGLDQALAAVRVDDPVGALAVCTSFALEHFLGDGRVGVWPSADAGLELVLGTLRGILHRHWFPDLDEAALYRSIEATVAGGTPRAGVRPVFAPHPVWVHAPTRASELLAVALSGAVGGALANQSAWVQKELRELEAIISKHGKMRRANLETWLGLAEDPQSQALRLAVTREETEFCAAAVRFERLVGEALAAYPPFAVYAAAGTVLGTLGEAFILFEPRVFASGTIGGDRSSLRRAVVGVALARLRDAVESAFPGAMSRRSLEPTRPRRQEASPYRAHASGEHVVEAQAYGLPEPIEAVFRALEPSNARAAVERGLVYVGPGPAFMAAEDLGSDERDLAERRQRSLRNARFWQISDAHARVAHALRGQFLLELWRAVTELNQALLGVELRMMPDVPRGSWTDQAVEALIGNEPRQVEPPAELQPLLGRVHATLGQLAEVVGSSWGLRGDLDGMIDRLVGRSDAPAFGPRPGKATLTFDEVCELVARRLPPSFVAEVEAYRAARPAWDRSRRVGPQVDARMTLWDHLDFRSTSAAQDFDETARVERERGEATAQLAESIHGTLMHALAVYPPAPVYFGLGRLLRTVQTIRVELRIVSRGTKSRFTAVLLGREEAIQALFAWTAHAASVFGPILSPGEWLAAWLDHGLRSQPSASARGGER